jgi:hypothetical protein
LASHVSIHTYQRVRHPHRHLIDGNAAPPADVVIGEIVQTVEQEHSARKRGQGFERFHIPAPRLYWQVALGRRGISTI